MFYFIRGHSGARVSANPESRDTNGFIWISGPRASRVEDARERAYGAIPE